MNATLSECLEGAQSIRIDAVLICYVFTDSLISTDPNCRFAEQSVSRDIDADFVAIGSVTSELTETAQATNDVLNVMSSDGFRLKITNYTRNALRSASNDFEVVHLTAFDVNGTNSEVVHVDSDAEQSAGPKFDASLVIVAVLSVMFVIVAALGLFCFVRGRRAAEGVGGHYIFLRAEAEGDEREIEGREVEVEGVERSVMIASNETNAVGMFFADGIGAHSALAIVDADAQLELDEVSNEECEEFEVEEEDVATPGSPGRDVELTDLVAAVNKTNL